MRTYRLIFVQMACLLCLVGLMANAQAGEPRSAPIASDPVPATIGSPPLIAPQSQPQIAFPLLKDYADFQLDKDTEGQRFQGWFVAIYGSLLFIGGETCLLYADFPTGPMADQLFQTGLIFDLLGTLDLGVGLSRLFAPPTANRHRNFQLVLAETDPVLREAMAAATLKGWSDDARNRRVLFGFLDFALAPVIMGMSAFVETSQGKPWYSGYSSILAVPFFSMTFLVSGGVSLLQTSPEERLYQKYQAARDAVYSLPSQGR